MEAIATMMINKSERTALAVGGFKSFKLVISRQRIADYLSLGIVATIYIYIKKQPDCLVFVVFVIEINVSSNR